MAVKIASGGRIGPRERFRLAGGVALAVMFAALLASCGGGSEPESVLPTPTSAWTTSVRATPTATSSQSAAPQTLQVFEGKDPFRPLLSAVVAPTGTAAPSASPSSQGGPTTGQRVSLLDVFTKNGVDYATVEVNGQTYTVKEGDTFAGSYRLVSLTDRCGTFMFGDERFSLCIGQEVLK